MTEKGQEFEELEPKADHQAQAQVPRTTAPTKRGRWRPDRPEAGRPRLVGQVGGEKFPQTEETGHPQGAEEVADEVRKRRPRPRRPKRSEDHGNDIGGRSSVRPG